MARLTQMDYANLLEFRTALRHFENWSQQAAKDVGLTPAQHQLLLAVKGHPGDSGPSITEVSEYLTVRHHSAVGLVDRAVRAGLVCRREDPSDARAVRIALTGLGQQRIEQLSGQHLAELGRLEKVLEHLLHDAPPEP
jgi:DNA-binding MarR family transcriptional regulator